MATLAARPKPVEIDQKRTALIVVDMQNAYAKKGGMLDLIGEGIDEERTRPVIAAHERLLPAARAAGVKAWAVRGEFAIPGEIKKASPDEYFETISQIIDFL